MYIGDVTIVLSCKTVLIYDTHLIICLLNIHNEIFYFSSIMLLKWDVTMIVEERCPRD